MKFVAILFLFVATLAQAQSSGQKVRPAGEKDFVGYWRIHLIANELHKSQLRNESLRYNDPCQFFIHKPNGAWFNLSISNPAGAEEAKRQCPNSKARVDSSLFGQSSSRYQWKKVPDQEGFFVIRDTQATDTTAIPAVLWKADYVTEDIPAPATVGFDLKKGDLIMQLTRRVDEGKIAVVWPMVLRPLRD